MDIRIYKLVGRDYLSQAVKLSQSLHEYDCTARRYM